MFSFSKLRHQVSFDLLMFRRNPAATFFTIVLPLIFLFLFTSIFGNETLPNGVKVATMYVPAILALAIITATSVNVAITMTTRRERGVLKRIRATPLSPWVFVASQAAAGVAISIVMTLLMIAIGRVVFGVQLALINVPSVGISLLLGGVCFAAMGLALTTIIGSEEAAPAVTNAIFLPLYFISDIFIQGDGEESAVPEWLTFVANLFPVRHLNMALQESFSPFATSLGDSFAASWQHWLVIVAWGAFAVIVVAKFFRWTPGR